MRGRWDQNYLHLVRSFLPIPGTFLNEHHLHVCLVQITSFSLKLPFSNQHHSVQTVINISNCHCYVPYSWHTYFSYICLPFMIVFMFTMLPLCFHFRQTIIFCYAFLLLLSSYIRAYLLPLPFTTSYVVRYWQPCLIVNTDAERIHFTVANKLLRMLCPHVSNSVIFQKFFE